MDQISLGLFTSDDSFLLIDFEYALGVIKNDDWIVPRVSKDCAQSNADLKWPIHNTPTVLDENGYRTCYSRG